MKKRKLEAKLSKTKKKLAKTRDELDAMLAIIDNSGMPKVSSKLAAGKRPAPKAKSAKPTATPKPTKAKPTRKKKAAPKSA